MSQEEEKKIVAMTYRGTMYAGIGVFADKVLTGIKDACQIFTNTAMTAQGPTLFTIAVKCGDITEMPLENRIIMELSPKSPAYMEWSSQWSDIKPASLEDISKLHPRQRQ